MYFKKLAVFAAALCLLAGQVYNPTVLLSYSAVQSESDEAAATISLKVGESASPTQTSVEQAKWNSENISIATVSSDGTITAVSAGTTYVNAIFPTSVYKIKVVVTEDTSQKDEDEKKVTDLGTVNLDNDHPSAAATLNNAPAGTPVWSSSDTNVATVDNEGNITAVNTGSCTVTAVIGKNTYKITINSTYVPTAAPKTKYDLGSFVLSDDAPTAVIDLKLPEGTAVVWTSSDENIATVDNSGKVIAHSSGNCTITAETDTAVYTASLTSTYSGNVTIPQKELGSVSLTQTIPAKKFSVNIPEGADAVWSSTDESVAVTDQNGFITAVGKGSCDVNIMYSGVKYIIHVTSDLKPVSELTAEDCSTTLNGIGTKLTLSGGDKEVKEWKSLTPDTAEVDQNGVVTSKADGVAVIVAVYDSHASAILINVKSLYLAGDANCNNEVKMNDAVFIMQSIANPDEFKLTTQGEINADCDGQNNGVSNMDALAIQKYLIKIYPSLPVEG